MSDHQQADDEFKSTIRDTKFHTPPGCLIGAWILGIMLTLSMWYSWTFLTVEEGGLLGFFMGLSGIPVLITAAILTVHAWLARRQSRP